MLKKYPFWIVISYLVQVVKIIWTGPPVYNESLGVIRKNGNILKQRSTWPVVSSLKACSISSGWKNQELDDWITDQDNTRIVSKPVLSGTNMMQIICLLSASLMYIPLVLFFSLPFDYKAGVKKMSVWNENM